MSDSKDRQAIRELVFRYAQAIDRRDFKALGEVFAEDAVLKLPHLKARAEGREQVVATISPIADMYAKTFHTVSNHLVKLQGDEATGETYCVARHFREVDGSMERYDMGIRYQDCFRREQGTWCISSRELLLDWEETRQLGHG